jgi:MSHA biogenesis protein MshQ
LYTFQTVSDEGVRVWVNNQLLIDHWTAHSESADSGQIYLQGGGTEYDIRVGYYEQTDNATMQLKWLPPDQTLDGPILYLPGIYSHPQHLHLLALPL